MPVRWRKGSRVVGSPNCLGKVLLLSSFFEKAGARYLLGVPIAAYCPRNSIFKDEAHLYLRFLLHSIGGISRSRFDRLVNETLDDAERAITNWSSPHMSLVVRLKHPSKGNIWHTVDSNQTHGGPVPSHWGVDKAFKQLGEVAKEHPGLSRFVTSYNDTEWRLKFLGAKVTYLVTNILLRLHMCFALAQRGKIKTDKELLFSVMRSGAFPLVMIRIAGSSKGFALFKKRLVVKTVFAPGSRYVTKTKMLFRGPESGLLRGAFFQRFCVETEGPLPPALQKMLNANPAIRAEFEWWDNQLEFFESKIREKLDELPEGPILGDHDRMMSLFGFLYCMAIDGAYFAIEKYMDRLGARGTLSDDSMELSLPHFNLGWRILHDLSIHYGCEIEFARALGKEAHSQTSLLLRIAALNDKDARRIANNLPERSWAINSALGFRNDIPRYISSHHEGINVSIIRQS